MAVHLRPAARARGRYPSCRCRPRLRAARTRGPEGAPAAGLRGVPRYARFYDIEYRSIWCDDVTLREKFLYQHVHPFTLTVDALTFVIVSALLWEQHVVRAAA